MFDLLPQIHLHLSKTLGIVSWKLPVPVKWLQLCPTLCNPMDCGLQGFFRQEHWRGLPFPPPGDLPNPGIKPASLMSPALASKFFTTTATWETPSLHDSCIYLKIWLSFKSSLNWWHHLWFPQHSARVRVLPCPPTLRTIQCFHLCQFVV